MPISVHRDALFPIVGFPQLPIALMAVKIHVFTECFLNDSRCEPPRFQFPLSGVPSSPRVKPPDLPHPHPPREQTLQCIPAPRCQFQSSTHPETESSHSTQPYNGR